MFFSYIKQPTFKPTIFPFALKNNSKGILQDISIFTKLEAQRVSK